MRAPSITALFGLGELEPVQRRGLPLVYASSLALMMGVNLIQPALPAMQGPLGISDAAIGLVVTVYTAPAIVLAPLLGIVADFYGRRYLLAGGLLIFGLAGGAITFAPNFQWVLILRAIQGLGFCSVLPLTIVLIGDLLEGEREVGGQGLKVFLDRVGYLIIPPVGGVLAAIAWFWPFLLYLLAVPLSLLVLAWMPETKSNEKTKAKTYIGDILRLAKHPRLLVAFSAGFLRFFLDYGFLTYLPLFIVRTHGVSTATAGFLYVFYAGGAMVTSSQAGRLAGRFDKARLLFFAFLLSGLSLVVVPMVSSVGLVGVTLIFYGLANGVISPMQKSLLTQNAPTELRGGIVSVDRLIQQVSKTVSTSTVGLLLVAVKISTIFWILGILSFISVALMATLIPQGRR
ncbi:MAG: MFS transporter [Candidatus Binatia bacterium]|nr:MFS transporter [Candidatus Binatia bacterium]